MHFGEITSIATTFAAAIDFITSHFPQAIVLNVSGVSSSVFRACAQIGWF